MCTRSLCGGCWKAAYTDEEPVEKVEVFFVRKKDGRLRMVVDCRRSNEWFAARQGQLGDGRGAQPHRSRGRRRRALHRHGRLERWEVVCLMAMDALALTRSSIEVALYIMLLAFVTYLRPGEVMKLHVRDLVPPVGSTNVWSLILHPLERETPLKTGEFDETALFDLLDIQWIAEHCFRLLEVGVTSGDRNRQELHEVRDCEVRDGHGRGRPSPLPSSARGPKSRCTAWEADLARNSEKGAMAQLQQRLPLREPSDAAAAGVAKSFAQKGPGSQSANPGRGVWPALTVPLPRWPKSRVYIEIFSGSGALGSALWANVWWPKRATGE